MSVVRRRSTAVAGLASVAVLASMLGSAPARAGTATPAWDALARCGDFSHSSVALDTQGYHVTNAYGYAWDQSVLTASAWRRPPGGDSVRTLIVYGLSWTVPLLRQIRTAPDGDLRLERLVSAVASTSSWRPDTGRADDPVWNEGVVLRREQSVNCLYAVTHDERLVPLLLGLVRAASDPARYYGPPRRLPHNHGLMSNLALIDTARLLGRADIRAFALRRLDAAIRGAFTPAGLSVEQSTAYLVDNITTWAHAARELRADGTASSRDTARTIHSVLVRAVAALAQVTDPSGQPVRFGDGTPPLTASRPQPSRWFLDTAAGVLAARWQWTSTTDYYAVRFGGPRRMHGHEDRGSVVWSTSGLPVLVDPGTATYSEGTARDWTLSPLAHSVASVHGAAFQPRARISLVGWTRRGTSHTVTLRGAPYGHDQVRRIVADSVRHSLTLADHVVGGGVQQVLQLDPRWRPQSVSAHTLVLIDDAGHRLVLTTSGTVASVRRGRAGLAGGWVFSYPPSTKVAAARVVVSGGSAVTTVLRVS